MLLLPSKLMRNGEAGVISMYKRKILLAILIAVTLILGSCSEYFSLYSGGEDLMSAVKGSTWPDAPDKIDSDFQKTLFDFSWIFFREVSQNEGNVLISPASVYLALGMTYNGADTETCKAMAKTLKTEGLSEEEFNTACRDYISILESLGEKTELAIANSVWYRRGFNPDKDFLRKNADYFRATAQALDFDDPKSAKIINDWVNKQTKGTIDKIVDKIQPDVVMYLINAVYFKSDWQVPFDAANTREMQFHTPKGDVVAKFMNRSGHMQYIDKNGVKGVILPYDDGRFSFFALLPKEGKDVRAFIKELDGKEIRNYLLSKEEGYISLSLPKFETSFEDSLKDELTKLGMGIAFDSSKADFSRMNAEREKNLYISEILHKTYCKVDELGTEASAVTSIEVTLTSMPVGQDIHIVFDRPFVYGIVDTTTEAPLFLGIMENPTQ